MLRFDRFLERHGRVRDLASGCDVQLEKTRTRHSHTRLFQARGGRTLIDLDVTTTHVVEVWEAWTPGGVPSSLPSVLVNFLELLECARHGAPRAFDLPSLSPRQDAYIRRVLAREARVRGWVPVALDVLAAPDDHRRTPLPPWVADRSLVIFADVPPGTGAAAVTLLHLARRDARPHVIVRTLSAAHAHLFSSAAPETWVVHEQSDACDVPTLDSTMPCSAQMEATARWRWLIERLARQPSVPRVLQLARVLMAREQRFEARGLLEPIAASDTTWRSEAVALVSQINERALSRAGWGWEMVDDFVDVLQLCQDVEDEQTTLAKVGTFVRDRLQASSVAFLAREGPTPRVLTRIGSSAAAVDLAMKTIETGVAMTPSHTEGPAEATCPVRHASDVIGALWCRWSAGMSIAPRQAATLLGIAAAAAAPSVRLAIARATPTTRVNPVPELVGESQVMVNVRDAIVRAAVSPFPVLIEGESGSGKELAARAIHARSGRRDRKFCAINCAALVDDLVEAELFGHVRGAFTGASSDRPGVFEDAHGGTLFLDEIAELSARVQAKLLRVLQEGEVRRVGETIHRKADVRIVAATNRPLAGEVDAGRFRADLRYRLDVIRITLPPLRERIEDVPMLTAHLWRTLAARTGSRAALSSATLAALSSYDWPGNIRELQNVLASLLVAAPRAGFVGPASLPAHIARVAALERGATLADARRRFEERYVRAALARAGGRTTTAARELGLSRQGLTKLMGRLGIPQPTTRSI
jgi:DNA-binding NtrC family response regulator